MRNAGIEQKLEDLFFITLNPPIDGFENFIGVWLKTGTPAYLVDVGPTVTIPDLIEALDGLKVKRLDYIFITHIHMDHAGGIGEFAKRFTETPIIVHKAAIPHLIDPSKLWSGSLKTLGDMARAYGPLSGVGADRLLDAEQFAGENIKPIITPGHAPHHISLMTPQCLFAGETCGVHLSLPDGKHYLRPATPPKFFLDTAISSIERLEEHKPHHICFGHHGMEPNGVRWLKTHKEQLIAWKALIEEEMGAKISENVIAGCIDRLKREDPMLAHFDVLSSGEKDRENYFISNSIKGFMGYIESMS
ncbi:MAG: MBL fold metallo-hydrolase [Desulfobacterales bacterium]